MTSARHLLFDLDGTLIDSVPAHTRAFVAALERVRPDLAGRFGYADVAGLTTRDAFTFLGLEPGPELDALVLRKQQLYREAFGRGEVQLFPGAEELLQRLHREGRRLYLVTGASRLSVERILEATQLAPLFSGVVTAEDVPRGKPAPDPYLHVLDRHQLRADDSLAIEDGAAGVESARAAGLEVVLLHSDRGDREGSLPARDFAQLAELLFP
jgi:HAD superfamily hydrolase (TIGR01509 family)